MSDEQKNKSIMRITGTIFSHRKKWLIIICMFFFLVLLSLSLIFFKNLPFYTDNNLTIQKVFTVKPQKMSASLSFAGVLEPNKIINIVSPITGKIKDLAVSYYDYVAKNQYLLSIDTSELEVKLRDAQTAYDKASEILNQLINWMDSPDVKRSNRSLIKAKNSLSAMKVNFENIEKLFNRGLVSASEYESIKDQYESLQFDFQTAKEELNSMYEKGSAINRIIAAREKENAEVRIMTLQKQIALCAIKSPVDGLIINQPSSSSVELKKIDKGTVVQEGSLIYSVATLNGFIIRVKVDEINIRYCKIGQPVIIKGEAFSDVTLRGSVTKLTPLAVSDNSSMGNSLPTFEMIVEVDNLADKFRKEIYLGMSVNLDIVFYERADALVIPINALQTRDDKRFVMKKSNYTNKFELIEVTTGYSNLNDIEITSGLNIGDEISLETR